MKTRLSIIVLVALVALMAASGASAKKMHRLNGNQHGLVKVEKTSADQASARWSHRALL